MMSIQVLLFAMLMMILRCIFYETALLVQDVENLNIFVRFVVLLFRGVHRGKEGLYFLIEIQSQRSCMQHRAKRPSSGGSGSQPAAGNQQASRSPTPTASTGIYYHVRYTAQGTRARKKKKKSCVCVITGGTAVVVVVVDCRVYDAGRTSEIIITTRYSCPATPGREGDRHHREAQVTARSSSSSSSSSSSNSIRSQSRSLPAPTTTIHYVRTYAGRGHRRLSPI